MGDNVNSVWAKHKELKQHIIKMENQVRNAHLQAKDIYQPMLDHSKNKVIPVLRGAEMMGLYELRQYHTDRIATTDLTGMEAVTQLPNYMSTLNEESQKRAFVRKRPQRGWGRDIVTFLSLRRNCWRQKSAL